jgi:hypothetical protein
LRDCQLKDIGSGSQALFDQDIKARPGAARPEAFIKQDECEGVFLRLLANFSAGAALAFL